jgi:predicted nucleic acid-binding protein
VSWLLDTNVLSEVRKGRRADPRVTGWYERATEDDLFTSVMVLAEIRRGVELLRRQDRAAALAIEQWLLRLRASFGQRVLAIDGEVAETWAILNVPDPVPVIDGLLAATALVHDLTLVTRDVRAVERTGVRVLNPWIT